MANKRFQHFRNIVTSNRAARMNTRFRCDSCKVIFDAGWEYRTPEETICLCYNCRNKYMYGKMQKRMMWSSGFEGSKKKH